MRIPYRQAGVAAIRWLVVAAVLGAAAGCSKGAAKTGQLGIKFVVGKPCLRIGETQKVDAHTANGASITYAIVYADGLLHGNTPTGFANGKGTYSASWPVPKEAPPGDAHVRILAVSGKRSGSVVAAFKVVPAEASCA